ncbi:hypothetical protein [Celeribacter sp.]|uniref:hypothetical protein n=1 Tax=Celeribacter sp. TaxID=1890673 RepID=UPI003A93B930
MQITRRITPTEFSATYRFANGMVLNTSRALSSKRRAILKADAASSIRATIERTEAAQLLRQMRGVERARRSSAAEAQRVAQQLEDRNAGHPSPSWSDQVEARRLRRHAADLLRGLI